MLQAFRDMDADGDGELDAEEIYGALRRGGVDVSLERVEEVVALCDADGNGKVSAQEYVDAVAKKLVPQSWWASTVAKSLPRAGVSARRRVGDASETQVLADEVAEPALHGPVAHAAPQRRRDRRAPRVVPGRGPRRCVAPSRAGADRPWCVVGSGTLNGDEIFQTLSAHSRITESQARKMLEDADADKSGELDFEEFLGVIATSRLKKNAGSWWRSWFRRRESQVVACEPCDSPRVFFFLRPV